MRWGREVEVSGGAGFARPCWVLSHYLVPFGCRTGAARDEAREPALALGWCNPRREGSAETKPSKKPVIAEKCSRKMWIK